METWLNGLKRCCLRQCVMAVGGGGMVGEQQDGGGGVIR